MTDGIEFMNVSDIVESNGKTIYANNMEKKHNIPLGALVEVKYDEWYGDGACAIIHARLWVVSRVRDCDGTPLYWLSHHRRSVGIDEDTEQPTGEGFDELLLNGIFGRYDAKAPSQYWKYLSLMTRMLHHWMGAFPEKELKVIEVTEELKSGCDSLKWDEKERDNHEGSSEIGLRN